METTDIKRKPITTVLNRRNAHNHPEFLDTDVLLIRFEPLLKSIHRRFLTYQGVFNNQEDCEDLYSQIVFEFLRLRESFDPRRGVDFTGFVKFHLQQRVYHYVMKQVGKHKNEVDLKMYSNDFDESQLELENFPDIIDEETPSKIEYVDAMASVPWGFLSDEQKDLVNDILVQKKTLKEIAKEKGVTLKSVKNDFDELCKYLELYSKEVSLNGL